jgi:probable HAF family extracellular repeat protein
MKQLFLGIVVSSLAAACGDNLDQGPLDPEPEPDAPIPPVEPPAPGIRFFDFPIAIDITPDGTIAVLEEVTLEDGAVAHFHDTITGETVPMAEIGDPTRNVATGISNTRALSALRGTPTQAGVWTEATDWTDLGSPHATGCEFDIAGAFDISADGAVVVGLAWNGCSADAFRWTANTGIVSLQVLGTPSNENPPSNRATVISDDGRIAAGFAQNGAVDRSPAVWSADGTGFMLTPENFDEPGEVLAIDGDGHTLAGQLGNDGFVWTVGTGVVRLARTPNALPSEPMFPNAMTADGALVFGGVGSSFFGIPTAFVWSTDAGTRVLGEVAAAAGIAIPANIVLSNVSGVSADGTVLLGNATDLDTGFTKTYVLRLPANAYALR